MYALSIATKINHLGWPWTAETSLLQKWTKFPELKFIQNQNRAKYRLVAISVNNIRLNILYIEHITRSSCQWSQFSNYASNICKIRLQV